MSYTKWFEEHAKKHEKIMHKLLKREFDKEAVIDYFEFENMVKNEPDFCPLYKENKKCHDMEKLNCYLCACPNFRFNDDGVEKQDGKIKYSLCSIDSKDGKPGVYGEKIHQDCSQCRVPHHRSYVEKNFDYNWKVAMKECSL